MPFAEHSIESAHISQGQNFKIGKNSIIRSGEVTLGDNVTIGDNVEVICDKLVLGDNCKIGNNTVLLCPDVTLSEGCAIGNSVQCELNEYLRLGKYSVISNRVTIAGQGVSSGTFLWLKNDVIIGGGGSQGPNAYLEMGNSVAVMDKAFINLSEKVTIGDGAALSFGVIVLTHGAAQPLLMGYAAKFAPVNIGAQSTVYVNSVILPGSSIGEYSTIAACSLVNKDIPAYALASGNPARVIVKGKGNYPRPLEGSEIDEQVHSVLTDYAATLAPKGLTAHILTSACPFTMSVNFQGKVYTIVFFGNIADNYDGSAPDISLSYNEVPDGKKGKVHFDLQHLKTSGELGLLAEDLRDYLRRRAIRIFTDKPFRNIPLSNLTRLKEKRKNAL